MKSKKKKSKRNLYIKGVRNVKQGQTSTGDNGQKTYWDPTFRKYCGYASGQQVKRSIISAILNENGEEYSPVNFVFKLEDKKIKEDIVITSCNPRDTDQLFGGYMHQVSNKNKKKGKNNEDNEGEEKLSSKRTGIIACGPYAPEHPLLASVTEEIASFDRREENNASVSLKFDDRIIEESDIESFLEDMQIPNTVKKQKYFQGHKKINGIFSNTVELDIQRLFTVSVRSYNPEASVELQEELVRHGWTYGENNSILICPINLIREVAPAIAVGIVEWVFGTNKSRALNSLTAFAIAVSDSPYDVATAIRAKLYGDFENPRAELILDNSKGNLYTSQEAEGYSFTHTYNPKFDLFKSEEIISQSIINYYEELLQVKNKVTA